MARPTGHMGTQVVGYKNLGEMQQVMARNAIVVRKEDALDLPAITDVAVPVHLSPRERDAYDSMKQQLAAVLANGALATVPNRLAQMMRLRQIPSGYVPDGTGVMQAIGDSKGEAARGHGCGPRPGGKRGCGLGPFPQHRK